MLNNLVLFYMQHSKKVIKILIKSNYKTKYNLIYIA